MRRFTAALVVLLFPIVAVAQSNEPAVTAAQVAAAIDKLGVLDFPTRMAAGRTIRRAPANVAVPALQQAVTKHADGYVRFRALVLLSGFNEPTTRDVMLAVLDDKNDRLRTVAYAFFEHHPDPAVLPRLLAAADREESEFVRPALMRTLAAHGSDPRVRELMSALVIKGQDFFRGAVIEAVGDYKGAYAAPKLTEVAKLDGPLQDDAVTALGKIGDKSALAVFAPLQRSAPRERQPAIAGAICLVGVNCATHVNFLIETLRFAIANQGFQDLLRASAGALATLAVAGNEQAAEILLQHGGPSRDPARAAIALALGTVALRNTPLMLKILEKYEKDLDPAVELLREAFDMLEEDYAEERFFVTVRRTYWKQPEASAGRKVAGALIQKLEF